MAKKESWEQREAREREESKVGLRKACEVLARLGVRTVEVHYDGAGDSGFIQELDYDPEPQAGIPEGLRGLVEQFVYSHLPGGWELNEGSFGTVTIDVSSRKARRDHNWRVVDAMGEEEIDI
jgi:hypothetical protein